MSARRHCGRRSHRLFGRLMLIWLLGMALVLGVSVSLFFGERGRNARDMLYEHMARDVTQAVEILEALPPTDRAAWLPRLDRRFYRFRLASLPASAIDVGGEHPAHERLRQHLGARPLRFSGETGHGRRAATQVEVRLADGTPLLVELTPPLPPAPPQRMLAALAALLVGVGILTWIAVRMTTRPLSRLAAAARALGEDLNQPPLREEGSAEVRDAARAFNQMQARLTRLFSERTRILAAVSHDLQTPITRLRLRAEMSEDPVLRDKLLADLDAMQALVEEGLAYAASASAPNEAATPTDLDALVGSLVADYQDAGRAVSLAGACGRPLTTRPRALKRLLGNLIDNALKFGASAELRLSVTDDTFSIVVGDRGPGIPEAELEKVFDPFYRIEGSRNRQSGGTGLGLAIARELAGTLGATLSLANRAGGGLEARLQLPAGATDA